MSEMYIQTAFRLGWLLQAIEENLQYLSDGSVIDRNWVRRLKTDQLPSGEEAKATLEALCPSGKRA